jgi:hypothetical protein
VRIVRRPLESFYNSLTDEQRRRFDAMGARTNRRAARGTAVATGLMALCSQRAASFTDLPVQRIEQTIRPTHEQQGAFDDLKAASAGAADELKASCPAEMPQTPMDRLDAVEKRLLAMVQAVKTLRPALDKFYSALSDEQKARFNTMGLGTGSGRHPS